MDVVSSGQANATSLAAGTWVLAELANIYHQAYPPAFELVCKALSMIFQSQNRFPFGTFRFVFHTEPIHFAQDRITIAAFAGERQGVTPVRAIFQDASAVS